MLYVCMIIGTNWTSNGYDTKYWKFRPRSVQNKLLWDLSLSLTSWVEKTKLEYFLSLLRIIMQHSSLQTHGTMTIRLCLSLFAKQTRLFSIDSVAHNSFKIFAIFMTGGIDLICTLRNLVHKRTLKSVA